MCSCWTAVVCHYKCMPVFLTGVKQYLQAGPDSSFLWKCPQNMWKHYQNRCFVPISWPVTWHFLFLYGVPHSLPNHFLLFFFPQQSKHFVWWKEFSSSTFLVSWPHRNVGMLSHAHEWCCTAWKPVLLPPELNGSKKSFWNLFKDCLGKNDKEWWKRTFYKLMAVIYW